MASVESSKMLAVAAAACDDKKAEDIRILALDPTESGLSDYFLICTGTNDRQTVAITDEIELRLKHEFGVYPNGVEGRRQGEWILMDYVDFIVHVFLPEKRAFYGLERLRSSATTLSVADLNAEIKSAIRAERAVNKGKVVAKEGAEKDLTESDEDPETAAVPMMRKRVVKGTAKPASAAKKVAVTNVAVKKTAVTTGVAARKRSAKKVASAKALDTRTAAKAAVQGARKTPAKKRARDAE